MVVYLPTENNANICLVLYQRIEIMEMKLLHEMHVRYANAYFLSIFKLSGFRSLKHLPISRF